MQEKNKTEKIRFIAVGLMNTAVDFGVLFLLTHFGMYIIVANYISTSVALLVSFFANKHFTFRSSNNDARREFISFLLVTLFGLWVLQPIVIWLAAGLISGFTAEVTIVQLLAKLLATIVSMVWNYIAYKRFVFKQTQD